jgi:hypothetical protein
MIQCRTVLDPFEEQTGPREARMLTVKLEAFRVKRVEPSFLSKATS